MSVKFISGKPGGGKSYYALTIVIHELRTTNRMIVTNLAINLPVLCAYLQDKFGKDFYARWRIRFIDHQEAAEFFRFYGYGPDLKDKITVQEFDTDRGKGTRKLLDYSPRAKVPEAIGFPDVTPPFRPNGGVLYVLDEVHEFFNARRWQTTGDEALHYLSQHRKLGDDVICISQSINNIDKQFRSVGQDYTYVRNHAKEALPMFHGLVRSVRAFHRQTYLEPYTGTGSTLGVQEDKWFTLDPKLAECYNTAAGVGVQGAGADTKEKRSGLPPWAPLILLALGAWCVWYLPDFVGRKAAGTNTAQRFLNGEKPPAVTNKTTLADRPLANQTRSQEQGEGSKTPDTKPPVYLTGVVGSRGRNVAFLSDGSRLAGPDLTIGYGRVTYRGKEYRYRSKSSGEY